MSPSSNSQTTPPTAAEHPNSPQAQPTAQEQGWLNNLQAPEPKEEEAPPDWSDLQADADGEYIESPAQPADAETTTPFVSLESALPEALELAELNSRWSQLLERLKHDLQRDRISLEGLLLLIGVQEVGLHPEDKLSKQTKQDLLHVGLCTLLEQGGYYHRTTTDAEGWPHFELVQALPWLDVFAQVHFLRYWLLRYLGA